MILVSQPLRATDRSKQNHDRLEMPTYILGMSFGSLLKMCLKCLSIDQKMSPVKWARQKMCLECLMDAFLSRKCVWNVPNRRFWPENVSERHFQSKNVPTRHSKHIFFRAHLTGDIFWSIERHSKHIFSESPEDIPSM